MNSFVKITAGEFRGRKITTPGGQTHPMGERERLALFNMIADYLPGAVVLDAYAGSGALGFEALSRGAKEVLFIDSSAKAESCIIDNMMTLGYYQILGGSEAPDPYKLAKEFDKGWQGGAADVVRTKVANFQSEQRFDVILADPPYDRFVLAEIEHLGQFLKGAGLLVLSHPGDAPKIEGLALQKSKKYAGATISIYVKG